MYSTILIIVVAVILIGIIYFHFFVPIINHISININRTTSAKRTDLSKLIITLSTASIVFSIGLMSEKVENTNYLQYAWFCFLATIILGVVIFLFEYIKDTSDEIIAVHEENDGGPWNKEMHKLATNGIALNRIVFLLFFTEVVALILALNFLLIFGTKNL